MEPVVAVEGSPLLKGPAAFEWVTFTPEVEEETVMASLSVKEPGLIEGVTVTPEVKEETVMASLSVKEPGLIEGVTVTPEVEEEAVVVVETGTVVVTVVTLLLILAERGTSLFNGAETLIGIIDNITL